MHSLLQLIRTVSVGVCLLMIGVGIIGQTTVSAGRPEVASHPDCWAHCICDENVPPNDKCIGQKKGIEGLDAFCFALCGFCTANQCPTEMP